MYHQATRVCARRRSCNACVHVAGCNPGVHAAGVVTPRVHAAGAATRVYTPQERGRVCTRAAGAVTHVCARQEL